MKTYLFPLVFMLFGNCLIAQVGINTTTPDASAILDVVATDKGMLVPRLTEAQKNAIATPATGLLVFQTNSNPGFYYYNGSAWVPISNTSNKWDLEGNTGTDPNINFVGTTDAQELAFRVNNAEKLRITEQGQLEFPGSSIFIGTEAGENTTSAGNIFIGFRSGFENLTGSSNVGLGTSSLRENTEGRNNTALGNATLLNNTEGDNNTAVGNAALNLNETGSWNTAVGQFALRSNTTGSSNTAIGDVSLNSNTSGSFNVAIGRSALLDNETGGSNVAVGNSSLMRNTTGQRNTALGNQAMNRNTTGADNVAVGASSLNQNISGTRNTAVGRSALTANSDGDLNTALGYFAMTANTTGLQNTAIGSWALRNAQTSRDDVAIGYYALFDSNPTASQSKNTAVGSRSFQRATTGISNVGLGFESGKNITTGNNNVAIGENALNQNRTGSNNTAVGDSAGNSPNGTSFSGNTFLGYFSGNQHQGNDNLLLGGSAGRFSVGNQNIYIGNNAGEESTGSNNVFIGGFAGQDTTESNILIIESANNSVSGIDNSLVYGEFDNEVFRINGELQVGNPTSTGYRFPTTDGTANQVMVSNGANQLAFVDANSITGNTLDEAYDQGGVGSGNTINATDGALRIDGDDGFLVTGTFGSGNSIDTEVTGAGTRMFFNPNKAAFRAGTIDNDVWDDANVGSYSFATGNNTNASGDYANALGNDNAAPSYSETSIGHFNSSYTPNSTTSIDSADRLFSIGNGTNDSNRSNALTILKDGTMNINDAYDMPLTDGAAGEVLTAAGDGTTSWAAPSGGGTKSIVSATLSANQSVNGIDKIAFDTTNFDTNGEFETANNRFVVSNDGYYRVNTSIGLTTNNGALGLAIYINNSEEKRTVDYNVNTISANHHFDISAIFQLSTNDYVEIFIIGSPTTTINSNTASTYFEIEQID